MQTPTLLYGVYARARAHTHTHKMYQYICVVPTAEARGIRLDKLSQWLGN